MFFFFRKEKVEIRSTRFCVECSLFLFLPPSIHPFPPGLPSLFPAIFHFSSLPIFSSTLPFPLSCLPFTVERGLCSPVRSERACVRDHKNPLISGKNRRRASYWSAGGVRVDGAALALRHPTTVQRGPRRRVLVSALGRGERRPYVGFGDGTFLLRHTRGEGNYSSDGGGRK